MARLKNKVQNFYEIENRSWLVREVGGDKLQLKNVKPIIDIEGQIIRSQKLTLTSIGQEILVIMFKGAKIINLWDLIGKKTILF